MSVNPSTVSSVIALDAPASHARDARAAVRPGLRQRPRGGAAMRHTRPGVGMLSPSLRGGAGSHMLASGASSRTAQLVRQSLTQSRPTLPQFGSLATHRPLPLRTATQHYLSTPAWQRASPMAALPTPVRVRVDSPLPGAPSASSSAASSRPASPLSAAGEPSADQQR